MLKELWHQPWRAPGWMMVLAIINFIGSAYGYYWYRDQLADNPLYLWPVIADSPVSTTLFAVALLLTLWGWRLPALQAVAVTTCIKYGIWAVALISHYWFYYQQINLLEVMLLLSHLGMVLQGLLFMRKLYVSLGALILGGFWLFLNDAMDYLLNLHPYLFMAEQLTFATFSAVVLSVGLTLALAIRRHRYKIW